MRTAAEDQEVTLLLIRYDRTKARLAELGVDVEKRDRANEPDGPWADAGPWCTVCKDKGGPSPLDPCPECNKYGPLA